MQYNLKRTKLHKNNGVQKESYEVLSVKLDSGQLAILHEKSSVLLIDICQETDSRHGQATKVMRGETEEMKLVKRNRLYCDSNHPSRHFLH